VQDGRQYSFAQTAFQFVSRPHDPERSIRVLLEAIQARHQFIGEALGVVGVERRSTGDLVTVLGDRKRRLLVPTVDFGVWRVAGEKASAKATLAGTQQVDVAEVGALDEGALLTAIGEWRLSNVSL